MGPPDGCSSSSGTCPARPVTDLSRTCRAGRSLRRSRASAGMCGECRLGHPPLDNLVGQALAQICWTNSRLGMGVAAFGRDAAGDPSRCPDLSGSSGCQPREAGPLVVDPLNAPVRRHPASALPDASRQSTTVGATRDDDRNRSRFRRRRANRRWTTHRRALPGHAAPADPLARSGGGVLRTLPSHGWAAGWIGRRDRALLVLSQLAGLSYGQIAALAAGDLSIADGVATIRTAGGKTTLRQVDDDLLCGPCGLARWVHALDLTVVYPDGRVIARAHRPGSAGDLDLPAPVPEQQRHHPADAAGGPAATGRPMGASDPDRVEPWPSAPAARTDPSR